MRKAAFPRRKSITVRSWMYESYQIAKFLLLLYQNMFLFVLLISTIVKCYILGIVITLHHANLLSKRSKSRCHPSPIRRTCIFHFVICLFCVCSCDKKNLKWISIRYDVLWNSFCVYIPSPEARGYKTHNSFHNISYGMKIHLRS